jgi:outer membrane protein TolC
MMNGSNMLMPMATVSIPIWRKKYTAAVRESEIMQDYVSKLIESQNDKLLVNYEEAVKQFRDAELRKKLYREQELIANQALNLLLVQYSTEGSNFEEVLRMQQQLLGYRLQLLNAYIDGNISVATLERLIGR